MPKYTHFLYVCLRRHINHGVYPNDTCRCSRSIGQHHGKTYRGCGHAGRIYTRISKDLRLEGLGVARQLKGIDPNDRRGSSEGDEMVVADLYPVSGWSPDCTGLKHQQLKCFAVPAQPGRASAEAILYGRGFGRVPGEGPGCQIQQILASRCSGYAVRPSIVIAQLLHHSGS